MAISLYMDERIPLVITEKLRLRGIDVVTAQDDGKCATDDPLLLDRIGIGTRDVQ